MKSKRLVELANNFGTRGEVEERSDVIILHGVFRDKDEQNEWLELCQDPPHPFSYVQIYDVAIQGDLQATETFASQRKIMINIAKRSPTNVELFVFYTGLSAYFNNSSITARRILCAELPTAGNFTTKGFSAEKWDLAQIVNAEESLKANDPRPFVRDLSQGSEVIIDLNPWTLETAPLMPSEPYRVWQQNAARKLFVSLANEISSDEGGIILQFSGPPRWRAGINAFDTASAYSSLADIINWVFYSGDDKDVRHLLCSSEIARAGGPEVSIQDLIWQGLESAKAAYEAHIQSSSRETIKALSDLRKTIIEDTQKITEKARGLAGDLWRDVIITCAPFVVKEIQDASGSTHKSLQGLLYLGTALFVLLSFVLQTYINSTFFEDQARARASWLAALYKYVSQSERQKISDEPIDDAMKSYRTIRNMVASIYFLLVSLLFISGIRSIL